MVSDSDYIGPDGKVLVVLILVLMEYGLWLVFKRLKELIPTPS